MIRTLVMVAIMATITYALRVLPITLIRRKVQSPFLNAFLNYVPFAILGALTIPDVFYSTQDIVPAIFGTIAAFLAAYFECGLLPVTIIAIATVLLYDPACHLAALL